MAHHVWLIQDHKDRVCAVGAGLRSDPYATHGATIDKRRDKSGTVWLSDQTFTTAADARLAASLVTRAIGLADEDRAPRLLADDGAAATGFLRGLPTRRKVLHYHDLERSLVVRVDLDDLEVDGRLVTGVRHPKVAADIVSTSWPLNRVVDQRLPVDRVVVVTGAEVDPPRVVGIWKVNAVDTWVDHGSGNWTIAIKKRRKGDRGGHVGRRFDWDGYRPGAFGYSHDLRLQAGLVEAEPSDRS